MDEKKTLKIVGAILFAALVVVAIKVGVNHLYGTAEGEHGEMAAGEAPGGTMAESKPAEPMAKSGEMASEAAPKEEAAAEKAAPAPSGEMQDAAAPAAGGGDPAAGKKVFQAHLCFACHSFEPGKNGVGPSLAGVFGHKAGQVEGYDFSDALKNANVTVDAAFLEKWLQGPQDVVPGTKMVLAKPVKNATDRANLIAYIKEESKKEGK